MLKKVKALSLSSIMFLLIIFLFFLMTMPRYAWNIYKSIINGETLKEKISSAVHLNYNDYVFNISSLSVKLDYFLTGNISSNQVILGEDNWLFYKSQFDGDPIGDFTGTNSFSEQEMSDTIEHLTEIQAVLSDKDIQFCLIVPPNKENVYYQYMPKNYGHTDKTRTDVLIEEILDNGISVINPKNELIEKSTSYNVYYKYDTHWNEYGAFIGTNLILESWDLDNYYKDNIEIIPDNKSSHDLSNMIGLSDYFCDDSGFTVNFSSKDIDWTIFNEEQDKGCSYYFNENAPIDKKLLLVGDSFRTAMLPILHSQFKSVCIVHRSHYESAVIESYDPDYMILEYVERYSSQIKDFEI